MNNPKSNRINFLTYIAMSLKEYTTAIEREHTNSTALFPIAKLFAIVQPIISVSVNAVEALITFLIPGNHPSKACEADLPLLFLLLRWLLLLNG